MEPITILMNEHRVIEQVLGCLDKMAAQAAATRTLDTAAAHKAIVFFRSFADKCHHGKEEAKLFPFVESLGFPRDGGPTGVMMTEHEEGRSCVRRMAEAVKAVEEGRQSGVSIFVEAARAYIALLTTHIRKEDSCLFPMAEQNMTADDEQALLAEFERAETEEMNVGDHEQLLSLADALAEQFGVAKADTCGRGAHVAACGHRA